MSGIQVTLHYPGVNSSTSLMPTSWDNGVREKKSIHTTAERVCSNNAILQIVTNRHHNLPPLVSHGSWKVCRQSTVTTG